jgi:hypothetical protein
MLKKNEIIFAKSDDEIGRKTMIKKAASARSQALMGGCAV